MNWELIITSTLALITMLIIVYWNNRQYKQMQDQLRSDFFADYTERFHNIVLHLPINYDDPTFSMKSLSNQAQETTIRYIRIYFDLCSEEYFLHKKGRLEDEVWKEWLQGMKYTMNLPVFKQIWDDYYRDTDYYTTFKVFVESEVLTRT